MPVPAMDPTARAWESWNSDGAPGRSLGGRAAELLVDRAATLAGAEMLGAAGRY